MRRFMVHLTTEVDFFDDNESPAVVQAYEDHLAEALLKAADTLSLRTVKSTQAKDVIVAEVRSRRTQAAGDDQARQPGPPMSLANMRQNGVRSVTATCANCGRSAGVNVDLPPEALTVPEAGKRLRCSQCGGETISTRPAWHTSPRQGVPDYQRERPPMS